MITLLLIFFVVFLVVIVVGLFVPRARLAAMVTGSVLLYLPSLFAWYCVVYFQYVDFDKLVAPHHRWTQHGRAAGILWFFGPPLVPSVILLLFSLGKYMYRRRRQA